ncbi:MAG: DNA gyrase subunit A [Eubacteriales bacterium]
MAKKKTPVETLPPSAPAIQQIADTLELNYMPYVMTVIISRAIPDIDGFKPSHRKLLYTMYKMGLLPPSAPRTKSANVVGQTMKLNPHGDMAIYETLVRLTRGNEALLHPFIDSKGSFGKQYSRDMAFAASRYTECKLDSICSELFRGIDKDAVDMVDNYDGTLKEPTILPVTYPNILVSPNTGIAVGMASSICSFNLGEVCDAAIAVLKDEEISVEQLSKILKAPDFSTGGQLIYNKEKLMNVYSTGRGSVRVRSRYNVDKDANCIDIFQIPYSTTVEAIIDKLAAFVKEGKLREISDVRDETDLGGLKLTIDYKRGTDPDKLMARLFKMTTLEDDFMCNFNVLVAGAPRQLGVKDLLIEWAAFRRECLKRELFYDLERMKEKLHLLEGLKKILLDIDKAIQIIRSTEKQADVVPNLMKGFSIDEIQAEFIAEIKLRHLNREYILDRIKETDKLERDIADTQDTLSSQHRITGVIVKQLEEIKKKFAKPRLTQILYEDTVQDEEVEEEIPDYPVRIIMTREGYFKKITHQSLRGNDEQKLKDGDEVILSEDISNKAELLFFTDKGQVYKARLNDFENLKSSVLGDYIPAKLCFDEGERIIATKALTDYAGHIVLFFENGKGAKIPLEVYQTKTNRRKLTAAYSTASPVAGIIFTAKDCEVLLVSDEGKAIMISTGLIPEKSTRTTIGVAVFNLKQGRRVVRLIENPRARVSTAKKYNKIKIPATGSPFEEIDMEKSQIKLE